ncbi:HpcH/HpaI aldolase/citrate lyase family protein [uncultured Draconibacterium sp.]|uniref:HpcH/HpaI aldolase/citrate lyase family protein n=1 Tax=uncultured Draconibacterium sp. TaxID=1573823 RepID=UPI0025DAC8F3|nr:HpcH/HpaI aldolase/citrate lyase family protein [uncultured Draconibacterium sp.]
MRHHRYNKNYNFVKEPVEFDKNTERNFLQYCLGATLYMPGTKDILSKILNKELVDITSMVMCLEDAIQESDLITAEKNIIHHLEKIGEAVENKLLSIGDIPLIFIRIRDLGQFQHFSQQISRKQIRILTGFVFPKFYSQNAIEYLKEVEFLSRKHDAKLYSMPILEGKTIAYQESRREELKALKDILYPFKEQILNIRVGGTDFSSLFGVRRGINYSIYDILTVRDCLADILNFFNRAEDDYLISAPVWEYFLAYKADNIRKFLNDDIHRSLTNRTPILNDAIDGLLREVIIDKANGFVGKTIIHPSHARFVNAMQCVTQEAYEDAMQIINSEGGVIKSAQSNKMNEINPHRSWANQTISRANAYGVIENDLSYLKIIAG